MLSGSLSIPIVCNDPDSPKTCQLADTEECMPLAEEIMNQMGVIYAEVDSPAGEERARAAAQSDYRTLADSICARASKAGWPSCPACSQ